MFFFILLGSLIFPDTNPLKITLIVFGITCFIELSQLIHNDFLNNLRKSFLIRALIGSVFNVMDFVYYFIGAVISYGVLKAFELIKLKDVK